MNKYEFARPRLNWLTVKLRTKLICMTAARALYPHSKKMKMWNELGGLSSQVDTVPLCA